MCSVVNITEIDGWLLIHALEATGVVDASGTSHVVSTHSYAIPADDRSAAGQRSSLNLDLRFSPVNEPCLTDAQYCRQVDRIVSARKSLD